NIFMGSVFENARRATIEKNCQLLELFCNRRYRQAVSAGNIADDEINVLALHQIAIFAHLPGGAACFVDEHQRDRCTAEPGCRIRRRCLPRVDRLSEKLGAVACGNPERPGCWTGEESDHTYPYRFCLDFDGRLRLGGEGNYPPRHADPALQQDPKNAPVETDASSHQPPPQTCCFRAVRIPLPPGVVKEWLSSQTKPKRLFVSLTSQRSRATAQRNLNTVFRAPHAGGQHGHRSHST